MELMVGGGTLGEYRAHSGVRGVNLHHKLERGVWLNENGGGNEAPFEALEGGFSLRRPREGGLGGSQSREGCRNLTVATNKATVKISEPEELL